MRLHRHRLLGAVLLFGCAEESSPLHVPQGIRAVDMPADTELDASVEYVEPSDGSKDASLPDAALTPADAYTPADADEGSPPTYVGQIGPILDGYCVRCHRPAIKIVPYPLTSYEEAAPHADTIAAEVISRHMPPCAADQMGCALTDQQIALIDRWAKAGAPQGP